MGGGVVALANEVDFSTVGTTLEHAWRCGRDIPHSRGCQIQAQDQRSNTKKGLFTFPCGSFSVSIKLRLDGSIPTALSIAFFLVCLDGWSLTAVTTAAFPSSTLPPRRRKRKSEGAQKSKAEREAKNCRGFINMD